MAASTVLAAACGAWAQEAAEIVSLQGPGEQRSDARAEWRPAQVRMRLPGGSFIRTLRTDSKMGVLLADQTQLNLAGVSEAQVLAAESGGQRRSIVDFVKGKARLETRTPTRDFTVRTPTGLAAIRGTEWLVEVDDDGTSRFTVVEGEIVISNDQGSLAIAVDEEGTLAKGRAPTKRRVVQSRDRVQWVGSFEVDALRYAEFREMPPVHAPRAMPLLAADLLAYMGDFDAALAVLSASGDARAPGRAAQLRAARGDIEGARAEVSIAKRQAPTELETRLAIGEVARLDGDYATARIALRAAVQESPSDARAWLALGRLEAERSRERSARDALDRAIALDARDATALALRGDVDIESGRIAAGRGFVDRALAQKGDDFEAWTAQGHGLLHLGQVDAATAAFLKATLIEPRHARAHLGLAIAYWRARRVEDALARLDIASRLDPRDPLPWQLRSMMLTDLMRPGEALRAAREAIARLPFTKSLDPVATDLRGSANLGTPLVQLGLEGWAQKIAQDSFDPLWAGSHLFLGDRLPGRFLANSELLQGFLADPLSFGASNRFQTLTRSDGAYATLALRGARDKASSLTEPLVNTNGLAAGNRFAWFAEASHLHNAPETAGRDTETSYTVGLGVQPTREWGAFLYANRIAPESLAGSIDPGSSFTDIRGTARRVDGGLAWRPDPDLQVWVKAGASDEDSSAHSHTAIGPLFADSDLATRPRRRDVGLRGTWRATQAFDGWAVLERSTLRDLEDYAQDAFFRTDTSQARLLEMVSQDISDVARVAAVGMRWRAAPLVVEGSLDATRYDKTNHIVVRRDFVGQLVLLDDDHARHATNGRIGTAWSIAPGITLRGAYQRWLRPASTGSLLPSSTAGVPLDDRFVLPGGTLERTRLQLECTPGRHVFASAFVDRQRIDNLYSDLVGVLNGAPDSSNLERLRNRSFTPLASLTPLEGFPVLSRGTLREEGITLNALVAPEVGVFAEAVHAEGRNTNPALAGKLLPYLPRERQAIGATYFSAARWSLSARAIHRGERFSDEANTLRLQPEWSGAAQAYWESRDKRLSLELVAAGLGAKTTRGSYGVSVNLRF